MKEEEYISQPDDAQVLYIVKQCLDVMREYSTQTKLTACMNLMDRILRLFCVCGEKEDVLKGLKEIYKQLKKSVEENFE